MQTEQGDGLRLKFERRSVPVPVCEQAAWDCDSTKPATERISVYSLRSGCVGELAGTHVAHALAACAFWGVELLAQWGVLDMILEISKGLWPLPCSWQRRIPYGGDPSTAAYSAELTWLRASRRLSCVWNLAGRHC
ncbi:hypothetical protein O181_083852 [Austropuccinia psidii MF-1]|uniref:Uncharacterized protein n=1 Tax=Austropuccinia psidii MF-1 TaxID=1389203 RepID=A0A9Q3IKG6_9BASI|nr:hypothetical protein [Austropuccinia psidii MF-1]